MIKNKKIKQLILAIAAFSVAMLSASKASAQCFSKMPTAVPFITSNFGIRKHPVKGTTTPHKGTDLRAPVGTATYAAEDGMITYSAFSATGGNMVWIHTNSGKTLRYLHHTRNFVGLGDIVSAGQQVGQSGNTGNLSAAPHLHFEVYLTPNQPVDARPFLCNPPEKSDAGPDKTLNPGAAPGGPVTTNGIPNNDYPPMGSGPAAATSIPQASAMPDYSGMSTQEFLSAESARRFGNPQWYRELNDPLDMLRNHPDPLIRAGADQIPIGNMKPMLLREVLFMMTLKDFYATEKRERGERMEQMLSTDLADRVNAYSARVLSTLRATATSIR